MSTLLDVFVPGAAKPKGSLRHVGNGRMVEQLAGSPTWRTAVRDTAYTAVHRSTVTNHGRLTDGYPHTGAAHVDITVWFPLPKSAPKRRTILPITRSSGDADKHARNILDALVDAAVLADDSQVIDLTIRKRYCTPGQAPGARITVTAVDPATNQPTAVQEPTNA